jgi:carbamate kinase
MARIVIALGGNALLRSSDTGGYAELTEKCRQAAASIAAVMKPDDQVVLTYGNGPVVGNILIRHQLSRRSVPPMPLDVCGAESQGNTGYLLERAFVQALPRARIQRPVASLFSLVEVDVRDPAFAAPTKPIGPFLSEAEAAELAGSVPLVREPGRGARRVVASPAPKRIVELAAIEALLSAGVLPITLGGGGVPVIRSNEGNWSGVEAVIDKDLSSSLLAREIGAETLIILTDVEYAYLNFAGELRQPIEQMNSREAEKYLRAGEFFAGSMAPKIQAGIDFLRHGGRRVFIGLPERLADLLSGKTGTRVGEEFR